MIVSRKRYPVFESNPVQSRPVQSRFAVSVGGRAVKTLTSGVGMRRLQHFGAITRQDPFGGLGTADRRGSLLLMIPCRSVRLIRLSIYLGRCDYPTSP